MQPILDVKVGAGDSSLVTLGNERVKHGVWEIVFREYVFGKDKGQ